MSELARLQERFHALVTARELVSRQGEPETSLAADFRGDARATATERLDVYANMYFFRIRDVLAEQFPRLAAAIDEERFHNLVTDYLVKRPPANPSLRLVGAGVPDYLATRRDLFPEPWLEELARFEWTLIDLFDGPDAETLTADTVHAMTPETLAALPMTLVPTHRVLRLAHRVDDAAVTVGEPRAPAAERVSLLVWRRDFRVVHRALDAIEATLLASCAEGRLTFAEACEAIAESLDADTATARAFGLLSRWIGDALLVAPK